MKELVIMMSNLMMEARQQETHLAQSIQTPMVTDTVAVRTTRN